MLLLSAFAAAIYGVSSAFGRRIRVPTSMWVVPGRWAAPGQKRFAFLFGLALGTGFMTIVSYFGMYLIYVLGLAVSIKLALFGMCLFAVARWTPVAMTLGLFEVAGQRAYGAGEGLIVSGIGRWIDRLEVMRVMVLLAVVPILVSLGLGFI
jgi:hypothetical protein